MTGFQTLGEEYVNIIQADPPMRAIPSRWVGSIHEPVKEVKDNILTPTSPQGGGGVGQNCQFNLAVLRK